MGCSCSNVTTQAQAAQSAGQHVNYTKGMVLGVDDFVQEFAYLAGHHHRAVRELSGYGTISGLAIIAEDTSAGPRLRITHGSAATPGGRLVCVPTDQCGGLNAWLGVKANSDAVTRLLGAGSPPLPPTTPHTLTLYLVLCYAECLTTPVPIPGEPCRSEDSLMAPSRIADDFRLDLLLDPPPQVEEDALRDFVQWLREVVVTTTSPPPPDDAGWIAALRAAAKPWLDAVAASPPQPTTSLTDYMFDSPPPSIVVPEGEIPQFLRVAFRFWVTQLRPLWAASGCADIPKPNSDCLLLAHITVPVVWAGDVPVGAWQVNGLAVSIQIDESRRPFLLASRMLEEWLLAGEKPTSLLTSPALPQALDLAASPHFAGLTVAGASQLALMVTGASLILSPAHCCVVCTAAVTITLPHGDPSTRGRLYIVKSAAGSSTIAAAAGSTIDGSASLAVPAGASRTLISDGTANWYVIGSSG